MKRYRFEGFITDDETSADEIEELLHECLRAQGYIRDNLVVYEVLL